MQKDKSKNCIDQFIKHSRELGLKVTPQRCAVYQTIYFSKGHPTAEDVYEDVKKDFPNISYDTVNRTLLTFVEVGLVDVVRTQGGPRRFDPVMDQHHHFQCLDCGCIIDFYNDGYNNLEIPEDIKKRFTVYNKRVVLSGLCNQCKAKHNSKK
jgi:Fur family peroxide stress response transcriptional regulator